MLADDVKYDHSKVDGLFNIKLGTGVSKFIESIQNTIPYFLTAVESHPHNKSLNENGLTQIFVEQLDNFLVTEGFPFGAKNQYCDTFLKTKGIPDFYFHTRELGSTAPALFVVESKILPPPKKSREKEYVIGVKNNGGIERFKLMKHGINLTECGLLGFLKDDDPYTWLQKINTWIIDLSQSTNIWFEEELLSKSGSKAINYYTSVADRRPASTLNLHHIWITL